MSRASLVLYARVMRAFSALYPVALCASALAATGPDGGAAAANGSGAGANPAAAAAVAAASALAQSTAAAVSTATTTGTHQQQQPQRVMLSLEGDDDDDDDDDDENEDDDGSLAATTAALAPSSASASASTAAAADSGSGSEAAQSALPPAFGSASHAFGPIKRRHVDSSRLACIQRAFDVFTQLDSDNDQTITVDDLVVGLGMFDASISFTRADAERIFRIADTTRSGRVSFAEFYAIYACLTLMQNKFGLKHDMLLTPTQVKSAFLEAGLNPSDKQLSHMFRAVNKGGEQQEIHFAQVRAPNSHVILLKPRYFLMISVKLKISIIFQI